MQREQANVWLKSRSPDASARLRGQAVTSTIDARRYEDIEHAGRRFRFSHAQHVIGEATAAEPTSARELWLVFEDSGRA